MKVTYFIISFDLWVKYKIHSEYCIRECIYYYIFFVYCMQV